MENAILNRAQDDSPLHVLLADMLVDVLSTMVSMFEEGVSEYTLISMLKKPPYSVFDEEALRDPLMLFKTHFILFNALYQLRLKWLSDGVGELDIHTLNVRLISCDGESANAPESSTTATGKTLGPHHSMASYYLDWRNFEQTDEECVDALLTSFWSKMGNAQYVSFDDVDIEEAHLVLGLTWAYGTGDTVVNDTLSDGAALNRKSNDAYTLKVVKKHYRKKLQQLHPDKGGNREQAQQVISAYQLLVRFYSFK